MGANGSPGCLVRSALPTSAVKAHNAGKEKTLAHRGRNG
jgi:hypothetical protein